MSSMAVRKRWLTCRLTRLRSLAVRVACTCSKPQQSAPPLPQRCCSAAVGIQAALDEGATVGDMQQLHKPCKHMTVAVTQAIWDTTECASGARSTAAVCPGEGMLHT